MTVTDVLQAQLVTEVGVAHEMGYHPDERRRIAIHEAGHALTAVLTRRDVKMASILRRSAALGLVAHGDIEERFLKTPSDARDLICVALAGRAAELQEYGEASSGISSDLAVATNLASQLVGQLGNGHGLLSLERGRDPDGRKPRGQGALRRTEPGRGRGADGRGRRSRRVDDVEVPRRAPAHRRRPLRERRVGGRADQVDRRRVRRRHRAPRPGPHRPRLDELRRPRRAQIRSRTSPSNSGVMPSASTSARISSSVGADRSPTAASTISGSRRASLVVLRNICG